MEIITRLPGCPADEDFRGPEENPAYITSVGKVIPSIKGHMQLPPGYKSFDISTGFYNSIDKKKETFNLRWVFTNHQKFAKFQIPHAGTVVQVGGKLVGRINSTITAEQILICLIDTIEWIMRIPSSGPTSSI
jgi:hypothetical protein